MVLSRLRPLLAALVLLLPLLALYRWQSGAASSVSAPELRPSPIGSLTGQAQVLRAGDVAWQTVTADSVYLGDAIRAVAAARVQFSEGTLLDLEPAAHIVVTHGQPDQGILAVQHVAGRLVVDTNNPRFRLDAPSLALTVERARFRVEMSANGDAYVISERGLVYSASDGEVVAVAEGESLRSGIGQRAVVQPGTPIALPPPPPPPPRTPTATPTPAPPTQPPERIHVVARGDTLSEIAAKYGVSQDVIVKANSMDNPNMLYVGQKLIIPPSK